MRISPFLLAASFLSGFATAPALSADRKAAEDALVSGVTLYRNGNSGGARAKLVEASKADPKWALAHAVNASIILAGGDGYGGEAEAKQALELGMKPDQVNQLLAHAYLLQGNASRALAQSQLPVSPRYAGYSARVRALAFASMGDQVAAGREFDRSAQLNPKSAALWANIAQFRNNNGDVLGAIDASARAVEINPKRLDALGLMAALIRGQFGLTAALPWYRRALALDPNNMGLLREFAATLGDAGQTVEMLATTRKMIEIDPENADAFYLQAVLAARGKKYELARSLLYRTKGKLDAVPGAMLLDAALELQAGNAERAIAIIEDIVGQQPGNLKAQRLLGAALWRAGDNGATISALERLADRSDADSYTLSVIGRAYEAEGDREQAATYLDRAAEPVRGEALPFDMKGDLARLAKASVGPSDNADFAVPYINKLVLEGRNAEALNIAERLRTRNPGAPAAHVLVGDALIAQGRVADAANAYRAAANIRFSEPIALRLIDAMARSGNNPGALRTLDLFLSQNPRSVAGLLLAADHFMERGKWTAATDVLEGLRNRLGNRDAEVLSNLGWAWFNTGNKEKAVSYAGAAYAMAPANPAFAHIYGWVLFKTGKNKEGGAALLEKAVATAPGHPVLRYHLGQAMIELGRKDAAKEHLRKASLTPDYPDAKAAAKLLAGL